MEKKKRILTSAVICFLCLFTGCEKTPEDVIVKQKGQKDMSAYAKEELETSDILLMEELGAPKTYQDEVENTDGNLKLAIDAEVVIPNVSRVPIYKVKEKEFSQEFIDTVTETFFGAAPIYSQEEYFAWTKEEIASRLAEVKEEIATGNYDWELAQRRCGEDVTKEAYKEFLQGVVEEYEKVYEEAPEIQTNMVVRPEMGDGNYIVEMDEDHSYTYVLQAFGGYSISINRRHPEVNDVFLAEYEAMKGSEGEDGISLTEAEVESLAGFTIEEAKAKADANIVALGLSDMELYGWDYGIIRTSNQGMEMDNQILQVQGAGYWLYYTRKVCDIPVTYTWDSGGALESMDDERETWNYERVNIFLTNDGIENVLITSLYDMDEEEASSIQLMGFGEIMEIFKNMMLISNAETTFNEEKRVYHVKHITFGYMRIYEPGDNSKNGTLIPVWDFFGEIKGEHKEQDGKIVTYGDCSKFQSHLTISALDGSLINRSLGY